MSTISDPGMVEVYLNGKGVRASEGNTKNAKRGIQNTPEEGTPDCTSKKAIERTYPNANRVVDGIGRTISVFLKEIKVVAMEVLSKATRDRLPVITPNLATDIPRTVV